MITRSEVVRRFVTVASGFTTPMESNSLPYPMIRASLGVAARGAAAVLITLLPAAQSAQLPKKGTVVGPAPVAAPVPMPVTASVPAPGAVLRVTPRGPPPPPPAGLSVKGTPASATVTWQPLSGVTTFLGTRKTANTPDVTAELAPTNTGWFDPGLQAATAYVYRITANYPDGRSAFTEISFTTPSAVNPAGLTAQLAAPGQVRLSWQPVSDASYYVVFGPGSSYGGVKVSGATSYVATGVPAGTQEWAVASYYEPGLAPLPANTPLLGLPAAWPRLPKAGVMMVPLQDGAFKVGLISVAPARYELYLTVERMP